MTLDTEGFTVKINCNQYFTFTKYKYIKYEDFLALEHWFVTLLVSRSEILGFVQATVPASWFVTQTQTSVNALIHPAYVVC